MHPYTNQVSFHETLKDYTDTLLLHCESVTHTYITFVQLKTKQNNTTTSTKMSCTECYTLWSTKWKMLPQTVVPFMQRKATKSTVYKSWCIMSPVKSHIHVTHRVILCIPWGKFWTHQCWLCLLKWSALDQSETCNNFFKFNRFWG